MKDWLVLNPDTTVTRGTFKIDVISRLLETNNNVFVLTQTEMNIVGLMSDGKFVTPIILESRLKESGYNFELDRRKITNHLCNLRTKLGPLNIETLGNGNNSRTRLLNWLD